VKPHPVKVHLAARGESQVALAARIGISAQTLNRCLNGHLAPWPALRRRLAEGLNVTEAELFPEQTLEAEARRLAAKARAAQGMPATVTDVEALARIGRTLTRTSSGPAQAAA
jgi:transcriptional regulator with XRE-family HTH domain